MQHEVLGDDLLRRHVGDADERQDLVRPAGGEQRRRQLQRVRGDDVVVGQAVDQQQRAGQPIGERQQRVGVVDVGLLAGIAEVALGVVRVVETPLGDRRAGDGGVEDVGPAQHGERGEVAAEAPAADGDALEVEHAVLLGGVVQGGDLVVEDRGRQVVVDRPLPLAAAARRAATVGDDDGEPLVGEPLRGQVGVVGPHGRAPHGARRRGRAGRAAASRRGRSAAARPWRCAGRRRRRGARRRGCSAWPRPSTARRRRGSPTSRRARRASPSAPRSCRRRRRRRARRARR